MTTEPLVSQAEVIEVRVADVKVGVRRRRVLRGIASLAKSIAAHGPVHPILIRNGLARDKKQMERLTGLLSPESLRGRGIRLVEGYVDKL